MRKFVRTAQLGLATLAVVIGLGGFAGPAHAMASGQFSYEQPTFYKGTSVQAGTVTITEVFAARAWTDCTDFHVCIWTSSSYSGSRKETGHLNDGVCTNYSSPYDNNASSVYNNADDPLSYTLWESYNGTGSRALSVLSLQGFSSFSGLSGWADNIASSICGGD